MALTGKQIGTGLIVVGLAGGGWAFYDWWMKTHGTTQPTSELANPSVSLAPGLTIKADTAWVATVTVTNTTSAALPVGVQGAMIDSTGAVRGHWFTGFNVDSTSNIAVPVDRVATMTIGAGQSQSVKLYQVPRLPGTYQSVFWIAPNPPANELIAVDSLGIAQSAITLNVSGLALTAPNLTVS